MKLSVLCVAVGVTVLAGTSGTAQAKTITFDSSSTPGISLGGSMLWSGNGGGHLWMQNWLNADYVIFSAPAYVNDFQMNWQPWSGVPYDPSTTSGWDVSIAALDAANSVVWSTTVDFKQLAATAYDWSKWLTVSVNTANVSRIAFGTSPLGGDSSSGYLPIGYWPSIDNMRIDEADSVPEPASIALLGLGLAGLGFSRLKPKAK